MIAITRSFLAISAETGALNCAVKAFAGSAFEARLVLGVLAWVAMLGVVFAIGGVQLWRQGRYHPWFAKVAFAMAVITVAGIYRLNHLFS